MPVDVQAAIAGDHEYVDATETVTFKQPGSTSTITVLEARRANRPVQMVDAGSGAVIGSGVLFYFWIDECSARPKHNARVTDAAGLTYRVEETAITTMRTRYDVTCVKEV